MSSENLLSLFISSKMAELREERLAVEAALAAYHLSGWLFELDAGARPESIRSVYLKAVEACDVYVGLFWQGYGEYTVEAYEHAHTLKKPCLIYEKHVALEGRDPRLTEFLSKINRVATPEGVTLFRFETTEDLTRQVQKDVMRLLTSRFRDSRTQPVWNIPYRRNPFFTGREALLTTLHGNLTAKKVAALTQPQAISGLGGIGKTQTAVEYAYRHRDEYQVVLWVNAASQNSIVSSFLEVARLLKLPEQDKADQRIIIEAVMRWFTEHYDWLVIYDNADDLSLVEEYLPRSDKGHILLTTREQAPGALAQALEVEQFDHQEGVTFLLRRAGLLKEGMTLSQIAPKEQLVAEAIVREMDGLPLALDQAGAYIEETGCRVAAYLASYQKRTMALLQQRRGKGKEHPHPVATAWSLSFEQVEAQSRVAADLLRVCAFLAPDAIPEELLTEGASELGPYLAVLESDTTLLDEAFGVLRRYSLVRRNAQEQTISMHRLVQQVLKESLEEEARKHWAERVVRAVNTVFPSSEFSNWAQCERLLSHALLCAKLIEEYILTFMEAARLLNQAAAYLYEHERYSQAEPLLQRLLTICEQELGASHPDTANSLNNLAGLYYALGKDAEAESIMRRALAIFEQFLDMEHPDTARSVWWLATLAHKQGKATEADALYQRALGVHERQLGNDHPRTLSLRKQYEDFLHDQQS